MSDSWTWETLMRYGASHQIIETKWAALQAYARRELREGMQWLADELHLEALEQWRADDDGMAVDRTNE